MTHIYSCYTAPTLSTLLSTQPEFYNDADAMNLFSLLPDVKAIEMPRTTISDISLFKLSYTSINLSHLHVSGCPNITDSGLINIFTKCHMLACLNVNQTLTMMVCIPDLKECANSLTKVHAKETCLSQKDSVIISDWFQSREVIYEFHHDDFDTSSFNSKYTTQLSTDNDFEHFDLSDLMSDIENSGNVTDWDIEIFDDGNEEGVDRYDNSIELPQSMILRNFEIIDQIHQLQYDDAGWCHDYLLAEKNPEMMNYDTSLATFYEQVESTEEVKKKFDNTMYGLINNQK